MNLDALLALIDATVNPLGHPPKTTGPGLNAVLHRLAEAAAAAPPAAGSEAAPAVVQAPTLAGLPEVGREAALYLVAATSQLYRWDAAAFAYVPLAAAPADPGAALSADQLAALAAAQAPSATNAFATLADVTAAAPAAGPTVLATLPELTAPRAGAQAFGLPAGAGGVLSLLVREGATGAVRPVYPPDYAVAEGVLSVGARAGLQAGDHLSGTYYGAAGAGAAPGPSAPPAPAALTVPDLVTARVAEFVPTAGRTFLAYETTADGGATWQPATGPSLALPLDAVPAATYGVRVAATAEGVPASAATYAPALAPVRYVPGLRARYFPTFSNFGSDFQQYLTQTPVFEEVLVHAGYFADPVFNNYGRQSGSLDYFTTFFEGFLYISEPGTYTFSSWADDVSAMWLGEALQHPTAGNRLDTGQGVVLAPGFYPIRLAYSEQAGAQYGTYAWSGPGVSGPLNAGRLRLLSNQPFVADAARAPAGLLADPDFDQPMRLATWAPTRGWDVVDGVLLGADTDFTTASFSLAGFELNDRYELEISLELAGGAQLRLECVGATPASFVWTQAGVQRLALAPTGPSVQVRLRAENSGLVQVHYAQVRRLPATFISDDDPSLTYEGPWTTEADADDATYRDGHGRYLDAGATGAVTVPFTGTQVRLWAPASQQLGYSGPVQVFIDGQPVQPAPTQGLDNPAANGDYRRSWPWYTSPVLLPGAHTLRLAADPGAPGAYCVFDGLEIIGLDAGSPSASL